MRTIRTFIAIKLDDDVRRAAVRMIEQIQQPDDGIKWVPTDNLHLTLKFLGDVDNTEVHQVCQVLRGVCGQYEAFGLHFKGAGGFPELSRAKVLYAGIDDASGALTEIVSQLEDDYAELGFKREARDYVPHLTLGRCARKPSEQLIEKINEHSETDFGRMTVSSFCVYASFLDKSGPTYQVMDTVVID